MTICSFNGNFQHPSSLYRYASSMSYGSCNHLPCLVLHRRRDFSRSSEHVVFANVALRFTQL
jgi:hypothetical protein